MTWRTHNRIRSFAADETGSVLTFWAVTFAVFMGLIALSFDFGRAAATQSELQSYADNVALAAAGELNGHSDSILRATAAAKAMISDSQTFGEGGKLLSDDGDFSLAFFSEPPTPTSQGVETTDPGKAGYVQVTATQQDVSAVFGKAFSALTDDANRDNTVGANAVAGYTQYACDITPLMFCAPNSDFRADENVGHTVLLRAGGPEAAWGPGAFGFIDPAASIDVDEDGICAGLNGVNLEICLISAVGNRSACFAQSGVDVAGGQRVGNFESALNVRFDIYAATTTKLRQNAAYPPAPNVMSSWKPSKGQCIGATGVLATTKIGLPPDDCHASGTCGRFGDGNWSAGRQKYININYGGIDLFPDAQTRYDLYKREIELSVGVNANPLLSTLLQGIRPTCSPNNNADASRRVVVAASIDCLNIDLRGGAVDIPVIEFVELFLTAPIGLDGSKDIWVEIIGSVGGGSGGSTLDSHFREVVQLYK